MGTPPQALTKLRDHFLLCEWHEVYGFLEFVANSILPEETNDAFIETCNGILEREMSGYRFCGALITPITSEVEIEEVEEALGVQASFGLVAQHIQTALERYADRDSPDYRNSIKESISAVEATVVAILGRSTGSFSRDLKEIGRKLNLGLHTSLRLGYEKIYGYTSNADGIRHALLDTPCLTCPHWSRKTRSICW